MLRRFRDARGLPTREDEANRLEDEAHDLEADARGSAPPTWMRPSGRPPRSSGSGTPPTQEGQRLKIAYRKLVAETLRLYAALAADPRVKAALRALNKGRQPKLALGPREAYQPNVVRASRETLADMGLREERGIYILPEEAGVHRTGHRGRHAPPRDRDAREKAPGTPGPAGAGRRGSAGAPRASPHRPRRRTSAGSPASSSIGARSSSRASPDLRRLADEILARHQALTQDVEVRDALAEINRVSRVKAGLGAKPGVQVSLEKLYAMEGMIRTERISLEREGESLRVAATLNGRPAALLVDPEAEWVQFPEHLATELGVSPGPDARTVSLNIGGGRKIEARRATIRSLQVGPFLAEDVECLILPPDAGTATPVLGRSFLDRFVAELDRESPGLSLTQVKPKPTATPGRGD